REAQADAGALLPRGEKRREDVVKLVRGNAVPVVPHIDVQLAAGFDVQPERHTRHGRSVHSVDGVGKEVDEDLFERMWIRMQLQLWKRARALKIDTAVGQALGEECLHAREQVADA